eukprot:1152316-Pelagomonas_calceolata.AAC.15
MACVLLLMAGCPQGAVFGAHHCRHSMRLLVPGVRQGAEHKQSAGRLTLCGLCSSPLPGSLAGSNMAVLS